MIGCYYLLVALFKKKVSLSHKVLIKFSHLSPPTTHHLYILTSVFDILTTHYSFYSVFRLSTGFATAALILLKLIVKNATMLVKSAAKKIDQTEISMR